METWSIRTPNRAPDGEHNWLRRRPESLVIAVVTIVAAYGAFLIYDRMVATKLADQQADVLEATNEAAITLESHLQSLGGIAHSLAIVANLDEELITQKFIEIARDLVGDDPAVVNVVLAPNMKVSQVYPREGNEDMAGRNLVDLDAYREVTVGHNAGDQPILFGPLMSPKGNSVVVVSAPFFRDQSLATDGRPFAGLVFVTADVEAVMSASGTIANSEALDISLVPQLDDGDDGRILWGVSELEGKEPVAREIVVPGGVLQLLAAPKAGWSPKLDTSDIGFLLIYTACAAVVLVSIALIGQISRERREAERRLRDAIETLDHGFVMFDASDRFVMCNQAYRSMYSESADLLRPGVPYRRIITEGVRRGQILAELQDDEAWIDEQMALHNTPNSQSVQRLADGTWLKINERHLSDGSVVGIRVDITEIIEAQAEAEKAYQAKDEFISVLSHELRTPLTVILGYAKVLANLHLLKNYRPLRETIDAVAVDTPEISGLMEDFVSTLKQQGEKINRSGNHLLVLINDLLDYSKIEAGHFELKFEPTELKTICDSLIEEHSDAAEAKGIVLKDQIKNLTVELDPIRFKQVMINLLGNAIKFTDKGYITIKNSFSNGMVRIDVEDTGCGVRPEKIEAIFDAFQQADYSDTRRAGGTGLGLAISRQIVALHGGTLTATSKEGEGTCFSIEIPILRANADGALEARPRSVLSRLIG